MRNEHINFNDYVLPPIKIPWSSQIQSNLSYSTGDNTQNSEVDFSVFTDLFRKSISLLVRINLQCKLYQSKRWWFYWEVCVRNVCFKIINDLTLYVGTEWVFKRSSVLLIILFQLLWPFYRQIINVTKEFWLLYHIRLSIFFWKFSLFSCCYTFTLICLPLLFL